jgi:signal transduction histidine kinase/ActR/RegA family two-component response regulator
MFDIDGSIIWGRAHLRSVRVGNGRSLLLLVEDLTLEKKQLLMNQRHREELAMRVQERTAELMRINERLEQEMGHRARAEEELRKSERSKAIAEMAGGVAHNFNNLLQILMHGAQMALVHMESGNPTRARAKIKRLIESCKQGAETIRRLQAFAQVRTPDAVKEGKVFDLSETVEKALDMHGPWLIADAEKEGIKIAFQKQLQPNSFVEGHEGELLEVVVNLIKNAAEALTQGGEIRVSTFVNHGKVFLQVRDNGIGIPRENLGKVFQPFWTTKGYHGTGMGLASSLGIVKRHQGQIVLDSREQLGTTVTVTMPFTGQPETDLSSLITCALDRKLSILIIDDESEALTLLEEGFTELGHEVFAARSGQEGIEIFRKNRVDLVISDLAMPGMNGWQVGRAIKEICEQKGIPKAPLILLTGWGGQLDEKEKIEASGIDRVAEKPVSLKELLRLVQEIVGEAG